MGVFPEKTGNGRKKAGWLRASRTRRVGWRDQAGRFIWQLVGFWPALFIAPLLVAVLGAAFEKYCLRRVHKFGHVPELLITFGLSYIDRKSVV